MREEEGGRREEEKVEDKAARGGSKRSALQLSAVRSDNHASSQMVARKRKEGYPDHHLET